MRGIGLGRCCLGGRKLSLELGVVLDDLLAVGCCGLDVRVELLDVCLELLDAGSLRGIGLRRRVARRRRRELRLELGHALWRTLRAPAG